MATKKTRCCFAATILTALLGAIIFGGAWLAQYGIREFVRDGILDQAIIDSPSATNNKHWQTTYASDAPTLYIGAHFFNITNLDDVRKGALPIVKEVGPYVYWNKKDLIDIEWLDNNNRVKYNTMTRYIFFPDLSAGPDTDVIVQINPGYPGALSQSGGEQLLVFALTGPAMRLFVEFMIDVWIPDLVVQTAPGAFAVKQNQLTNGDALKFYANWANETQPISAEWSLMQVSLNATAPSGISVASAQQLFNASVPLSLLATDKRSTTAWRQALNGNATYSEEIRTSFDLTANQMSVLLAWYRRALDGFVVPSLLQKWNVAELNDLAYLQWGTGQVTGKVSVTSLYPGLTDFPAWSELGIYWGENEAAMISADASKKLLNGTAGVFNPQNLGLFVTTTVNPITYNETYVNETWGITRGQADAFYVYLLYMWTGYSFKLMDDAIARGGGLFTARTVHEWLMENTDPLLELLSPEAADASLLGNETTPEKARKKHGPNIVYTGKDDPNKLQVYTQWFGLTVIEDVYREPLNVSAVNDLGFFQPFLDINTDLWSWDSNYVRPMHLVPLHYIDHKGITAIRYTLANDTWDIRPEYYQTIKGFCNLTNFHNGTSLMLSNPHMYMADPKYTSLIQGQTPNPAEDITRIDIEPNTGNVVWYDESLQINIYLDPSKSYLQMTTYNPEVRMDVIYPVAHIHMYAGLTEDNADQVKDSLYLGFKAETIIFWAMLGVGGGFLLLSVLNLCILLLCVKADRRRGSIFDYTRSSDGALTYSYSPVAVGDE